MVHHALARQVRSGRMVLVAGLLVGGLWGGPWVASARAQGNTIPSTGYQATFSLFYDGEYADALRAFRDQGRGALKTPQARWIDSICYETMIGECYYHMGSLGEAMDHYEQALRLYLAYPDWMLRVQFPTAIQPAMTRARIPWGVSARQSRLGDFPTQLPVTVGQLDLTDVVKRGGVAQPAMARMVRVDEIIRCTCLAIRRRAELLGPLASEDPVLDEMVAQLSRRPGPPNHWSEVWIDVELGLAYSAVGKTAEAETRLKRAISAGQFDHPLTSTALLALGQLAMRDANYAAAIEYFQEATYSAFDFFDGAVLDDAFRDAALAWLLLNSKGVYPPLVPATAWATSKNLRQLQVSLMLSAAENLAVLGQTPDAASLLSDVRGAIGRRQMGNGWIGARRDYLSALVLFQQNRPAEGYAALTAAMRYMQQGSHWLFQIATVDAMYVSRQLSDRQHLAMDLFGKVLRDPQSLDWATDPMEAMAVLVTPHPGPIDHWFEVALAGKEFEAALEISDRARRHRFFCTLPLGGRVDSLRWILEGPVEQLDPQSRLLRGDLLTRYPAYEQAAQQVRKLRESLEAAPLVAEDQESLTRQSRDLELLATLSAHQEAVLREIAVRREPVGLVFPPLRPTEEIQKSLAPGQAMLAFFVSGGQLHAFLLNDQDYALWRIGSLTKIHRQVMDLLRAIGQYQPNQELTLKDLSSDAWKTIAKETLDSLLEGSRADFSQEFDELIIVPDGVLWYLPFEVLQVEIDGGLRPLISRFRIRYAPTVSLVTSQAPVRTPTGNTAVVVGRLFPRDDEEVAVAAFDEIDRALPGSVALGAPAPGPSAVYASLFDRLIVLDDMNTGTTGPLEWAPMPIDQGKPGGSVMDWLALPWDGPDEIVLPGFHTAAETALKGVNRTTAGNEIFLSVCGLMAGGSRTLLLSRWRTGGKTSFDLVREFVQELPRMAPDEAWQRSVFLAAGSQIDPDAEPRVKNATVDTLPKATHPFLWAGYMLVDPGTTPQPTEPPEPFEPVLKFKPVEPVPPPLPPPPPPVDNPNPPPAEDP